MRTWHASELFLTLIARPFDHPANGKVEAEKKIDAVFKNEPVWKFQKEIVLLTFQCVAIL